MSIEQLLGRLNAHIINPFILLLFAVALVVFVWGIVEFLASEEGGEARERGKRNLGYGIIGLLIMVSVYGIINVVLNTIGVDTGGPGFYFLP